MGLAKGQRTASWRSNKILTRGIILTVSPSAVWHASPCYCMIEIWIYCAKRKGEVICGIVPAHPSALVGHPGLFWTYSNTKPTFLVCQYAKCFRTQVGTFALVKNMKVNEGISSFDTTRHYWSWRAWWNSMSSDISQVDKLAVFEEYPIKQGLGAMLALNFSHISPPVAYLFSFLRFCCTFPRFGDTIYLSLKNHTQQYFKQPTNIGCVVY